uniref:Uncharacterized protein n=1 Tax=Oryza punctata TaxID=4537 RepID=A0A0E0JYK4_ORYPU
MGFFTAGVGYSVIRTRFPSAVAWGQAPSRGGANVTPVNLADKGEPTTSDEEQRMGKEQGKADFMKAPPGNKDASCDGKA